MYAHDIFLFESKLKNILRKEKIKVNSRHLYKIASNGVHNISAISKDGTIEAIESRYNDYNIGVQWHPEDLDDENSNNLFASFVDAAEIYKHAKTKRK